MAATYTVKQVAEILGYSTNSIYTFLKEKRIKGVRVGKGRFRIPQGELNRLLLISKTKTSGSTPAAPATGIVPITGTLVTGDNVIEQREYTPFSLKFLGRIHIVTANIFDWFIGIAAIVAGFAMFLFNQSFDLTNISSIMPIIPAIRILFIGGGIGILLTNLVYDSHKVWHNVFHCLLTIAGIALTIFLIQTRDFDAVAIYGSFAFVIGLTIFFHMDRIGSFALYLIMLAVAAPIVAFLVPADLHVAGFANFLHTTPFIMGIALTIINLGFAYLMWFGYWRSRRLFWFCTYVAAIVYFAMAFGYASAQFWSRAFFFMVIGLTAMYLPFWEDLSVNKNKKAHMLAVGIFGSILVLLLLGIAVVFVTQLNVLVTVKREDMQKVDFARTEMETDIQNVKSTVTTAAINPDLIAAVQQGDTETLTNLSRIMFDSSDSIHRLVILDKNGMALFLYPLGTSDQIDLSFRDYFIQSRDTGRLYISDIFEALADNSHQKVLTISAPLYTPTKQFVGVLGAQLDLDAISARLQKIAVIDRGEYIIVLDSHGKRIMHPVRSFIGTDTEPNDPALLGIQGKTGVAEGDTYDGVHSLIAYTPINSSIHWAIALKAPFMGIYALASTANLIVAGLLIGCIMIAAFIFQLVYIYRYRSGNTSGGGP